MLPQWLKADHKRVGRRLKTLVSTGAVPQLKRTQGKDGKFRRQRQLSKAEIPGDFTPQIEFICGDALSELRRLPDDLAHCCVTSPPYYQQMDVNADEQIGQEETGLSLILCQASRERHLLTASGMRSSNMMAK